MGFGGILFLMGVGALFLAFNVAPTEEMFLIAARMTHWHVLALAIVSLAVMHGFVYAASFRGAPGVPEGSRRTTLFLPYTVPGYAIALLVSAYVLWTFGRYEGHTGGADHHAGRGARLPGQHRRRRRPVGGVADGDQDAG